MAHHGRWIGMLTALALVAVPRPGAAQSVFAQVPTPRGVTITLDGNIAVEVDHTFDQGIQVFNPSGSSLGYIKLGGFLATALPVLATIPANSPYWPGGIIALTPDGGLTVVIINQTRVSVQPLINVNQIPRDIQHVYDVTTGQITNFFAPSLSTPSSYGDIALLAHSNELDLFIAGLSASQAFPFVERIRLTASGVSARVVAASRASTGGLFNNLRGIAVNSSGTVLTPLPINAGGVGTLDALFSFTANFPDDGTRPTLLFGGSPISSSGMTADSAGNFYVTFNLLGSGVCSGCLLILPPSLSGGKILSSGGRFGAATDVAVGSGKAYVTYTTSNLVISYPVP